MTTYKVCFCFRRSFRAATDEPPAPVLEVFERYSEKGLMGPEHLRRFLAEVQGEEDAAVDASGDGAPADREGTTELPSRHPDDLRRKKKKLGAPLSADAFFKYLLGDDNQPLLSETLGVHQDMAAPLSHYFIYTGHNSYLTGNQLSSDSSDVPIIDALKRGVRVIELDMWPDSTRKNIDVLHGRTLTSPVGLMKCLKAVKEYAFHASPYPVILTLEDHLPAHLQAKVAKMLTQVFGEQLFQPDLENQTEFPSPENLKMRIVISTKPPKEYLESNSLKENAVEETRKAEQSAEAVGSWGKEISDLKLDDLDESGLAPAPEDDPNDEDDESLVKLDAVEYKQLIAIAVRKRKKNVAESLKLGAQVAASRLSLNEQMFEKSTVTHGMDLIRFTQRNLLRLFPKSTRFDSSNYNPLPGWMHGAQMVAFNMQGHGREMWLMQGMFRANGGCGYVKKPEFLLDKRHGDKLFDPRKLDRPVKRTLKVKVYMGHGWHLDFRHTHFDTYSPPDFYARVGIAGVPTDSVMRSTKTVPDSWAPVWNEEFAFPLTVPELALLRVEVHEHDVSERDDFGGQTCLPVWELRPGIRSAPLHDRKGGKYENVKLLLHFDLI